MSTTSGVERDAVQTALGNVNESSFSGAKTHLKAASQALSEGKYADAVRESVHAVESAASQIVGKKSTLSSALKILEKERALHPALKQAFDKLYGYAGDEQGIRHARIDEKEGKVEQAEALFIFSACAIFVSYLNRKYLLLGN